MLFLAREDATPGEVIVMRDSTKRWWQRRTERRKTPMVWQNPPPPGRVVFDPSLRTAGEMMADARAELIRPPPPKAA